ncbi:sulfotransferase-like domain-containing protein [Amycolatopsis samaneae]|uniref:Sulfotransferase family protein n=1 Tax=Amycolatopsis samaneae TaxID=664691 RepID=A0ABW5GPJ6_9PSEU
MTFQAGEHLATLAATATLPVLVPVRDPRLAVMSRMRQRERSGEPPAFPSAESGWQNLADALEAFRAKGIEHVVADVTAFRREPGPCLAQLCARLGLAGDDRMSSWKPVPGLCLGRLGGAQDLWYERVLGSSGIEPPDERVPEVDEFPKLMRAHLAMAMELYRSLTA